MGFEIAGVSATLLVALLVEFVKRVSVDASGEPRLKDRGAVALAVGLGVLLSVVAYLSGINPEAQRLTETIVQGLLAGLAACGIYSATKRRPQ